MKKFLSIILATIMVISCVPFMANANDLKPILAYDFENNNSGELYGGASISYDEVRQSNVLNLNGNNQYMAFPTGFFDGRDEMTINLDVKSNINDGNFFTFCYGKDNNKYAFLRVRGYETRFAVTNGSVESERVVSSLSAGTGTWHTVTMVVSNSRVSLYVNGVLTSSVENNDITTTKMGENLVGYLGKSLYPADLYFDGAFDNVEIYDKALNAQEVMQSVENRIPLISTITIGTTINPSNKGGDSHTSSGAIIDNEKLTITPFVKKNANVASLPISISTISKDCEIIIDGNSFENGKSYNLSSSKVLTIKYKDREEKYTILPAQIVYNSVISGQFADPDIDYINGKYWIFPTTDGYDWWSGYEFHAFSSSDLVNWTDEGVILNTKDDKAGKNIKGVQIATVPWSNCNAWAPTIEEKNGKYYFYFCANETATNYMAIGVAVASSPAGPYTVINHPLLSIHIDGDTRKLKFNGDTVGNRFDGQTIDPSVFTEEDGTSYLLFGNGLASIVKLNNDMTSVDSSTFALVNNNRGLGAYNFCESVYVIKRNGMYHFTWSCNGTDDERYKVAYGTAKSLYGAITYHYTLLEENEPMGILGTAHQSLVYQKDLDRCFIAYHRFYTPLGIYTDQYGKHRETCVDEVKFGTDGLMQVVTPSMAGTGKVTTKPASDTNVTITNSVVFNGKAQKPAITVTDKYTKKAISTANYTVKYSNNTNCGKATATITFKNNYAGIIKKDFYIVPKVTMNKSSFVYNGKSQKPTLTITDQKGKVKYLNYTITYPKESKKVGTYTVNITYKKDYNGFPATSVKYTINPVSTTISSVSAKSNAFSLKWDKKTSEVSGYQIQYALNSSFTKNAKTITVASNKTLSKTISKLSKKKKYYVRVRTYKTVNKTKYYSAWSKTRAVTTK